MRAPLAGGRHFTRVYCHPDSGDYILASPKAFAADHPPSASSKERGTGDLSASHCRRRMLTSSINHGGVVFKRNSTVDSRPPKARLVRQTTVTRLTADADDSTAGASLSLLRGRLGCHETPLICSGSIFQRIYHNLVQWVATQRDVKCVCGLNCIADSAGVLHNEIYN